MVNDSLRAAKACLERLARMVDELDRMRESAKEHSREALEEIRRAYEELATDLTAKPRTPRRA